MLWIRGDPGKGKTMLLCGIVDELENLEKKGSKAGTVSYFFCQATDSRINNATAILRGIIYSLINQHPSLILYIRAEYDRTGEQLFQGTNAWNILSSMFQNLIQDSALGKSYIIIDALDECVTDLQQLLNLITRCSAVRLYIKWIVSSRNWPGIERAFSKMAHIGSLSLELNEQSVSEAVAYYINAKVQALAEECQYNNETQNAVKHYLAFNAHGTFLWVALVCEELTKMSGWEVDETALAIFPPGLNSLYKRMMEQIRSSRQAQLCQAILSTLTIIQRPINLDEIAVIVEVPPKAASDYKALAEIIGYCGSFLTLRDRTIFFVHQSAKDFLSEQEDASRKENGHKVIFSRSIKAMTRILRRDIYNLQHPGIMMEEIQIPDKDPLAPIRYACAYWIDHFCESQEVQERATLDHFLKKHLLHWFEALSLIRGTSEGVVALRKLSNMLEVSTAIL